jgi:hypothetical protein
MRARALARASTSTPVCFSKPETAAVSSSPSPMTLPHSMELMAAIDGHGQPFLPGSPSHSIKSRRAPSSLPTRAPSLSHALLSLPCSSFAVTRARARHPSLATRPSPLLLPCPAESFPTREQKLKVEEAHFSF